MLKYFQGSVTVSQKVANYEEATFKLTNTELSKLTSAAKTRLEQQ